MAGNHDVEIQEMVSNVLGLAQQAQEISCGLDQEEKMVDVVALETPVVIRLINDAVSEDLSPISLSA